MPKVDLSLERINRINSLMDLPDGMIEQHIQAVVDSGINVCIGRINGLSEALFDSGNNLSGQLESLVSLAALDTPTDIDRQRVKELYQINAEIQKTVEAYREAIFLAQNDLEKKRAHIELLRNELRDLCYIKKMENNRPIPEHETIRQAGENLSRHILEKFHK